MRRVLNVITTRFVSHGGLTTVAMNYYRAMDKSSLIIDFASTDVADDKLLDELHSNGSEYYCLGNRKKNLGLYIKNLKKLLKENKYDVIHVHGNSATMVIELFTAKRCGVNVRIAHVHNTRSNYPIVNKIIRNFFRRQYTLALAVSQQAGELLYRDNFEVLNNAINTQKYQYNALARNNFRNEYNLADKFVIGTVGKLNEQKNHDFLLSVFACCVKENSNAVLVIAGGGSLEASLKKRAKELGIEKKILFLGMRNDVEDIIQGFDVFVFTSKFEGLGLAVIEAQAAGLECIVSDAVPKETKVTNNITYISLETLPEKWADRIMEVSLDDDRTLKSKDACEMIAKNGYDIDLTASRLEEIYLK